MRPMVALNLLFILAIISYKITGIDVMLHGNYQPGASNILTDNEIEEKDVVVLFGMVSDVVEKAGESGGTMEIRLAHANLINDCDTEAMTYGVNTKGKNVIKIGRGNNVVQIWTKNDSDVLIGSWIVVKGKLDYFDQATNPGQFNQYKFYKNRGYLFAVKSADILEISRSYSVPKQRLRDIRKHLELLIHELYGREDAAILGAMLLGNKANLDQEVRDSFQRNGIAHILAISGLHISFLCMGLYNILKRAGLDNAWSGMISLLFVVSYVIMVGATASALRAGIMFVVFLISKILKRSYDLLSALSLASILILAEQPGYLFDTAFLLSFMAVVAIAVFYKWIRANIVDIEGRKHELITKNMAWIKRLLTFAVEVVFYLLEGAVVSGTVFVVTLPIIINCYYEVAWYSVILNIIVVPLMGILLMMSILAILLTATVNEIAAIPLYLSKLILWLFKIICVTFESTHIGRFNLGHMSWWKIVLYYCLLVFICNYRKIQKNTVFITGVLICLSLVFVNTHSGLGLYMLDVGQGDCLIGINDNGNVYIFDGGSSDVSKVGEKRIIPMLKYMGVNEIEAIFLSHPDSDHISGIEELLAQSKQECLKIKNIYVYEGFIDSTDFKRMSAMLGDNSLMHGIDSSFCYKDDNFVIDCVYPDEGLSVDDTNNASLVLKLTYGGFSLLETGDIERAAENYIYNKEETDLRSLVLKVAHHGSNSSSGDSFVTDVGARYALISAGKGNKYGHPHAETLDTLKNANADILRTDEMGCICIQTDGKKIKLYSFK